jgi:predicted DNA-binding transcriptional regulator AlpA
MTCDESPLISVKELSEVLGWSTSKTLRFVNKGYFPGKVRFKTKSHLKTKVLRDFLEERHSESL